uniref:Uncharacterized protein n=1 Tax=viral metagenome TaxID=1070528 RepID=A0A6C0AXX0_9ZZZZ|tara:strand:+ start:17 stop:418 length:402 start_codon:yes stop_codon:yes gene_type:complete
MGLTIEVAFNICKNSNVTSIKQLLSNLSEKHNSINSYFIHEIEGHSTITDRHDCINIIEFDEIDINNAINYIKDINKLNYIKIECIYQDKGVVNIIYASKKYLLNANCSIVNYKPTSTNKIIELIRNTVNVVF